MQHGALAVAGRTGRAGGIGRISRVARAEGAAGAEPLTVSLAPCPPPSRLRPLWLALQAQAETSFFTSWTWLSCWLQHLGAGRRPQLLQVHQGHELVGLGVVVQQATRRLRCWPSQALHLHATGERALDDITVEHNGLLCKHGLAREVRAAVASQLWRLMPEVDQFHLPGVCASPQDWRSVVNGVHRVTERSEPAYRVDLAPVRQAGSPYLETLGPQTRGTVRRSLRLYEARGRLKLVAAATVEEGLAFLDRQKQFHQQTWESRGRPGAFANPFFERFHQGLVQMGLPRGEVELLRLTAGKDEVGYLYNFVHGRQVLAYQSGFHFALTDRNHHPGLVTHALAAQRALERGMDGYDLMAGEARYKQQLANHSYTMSSLTLHRPSLGWWLEQAWRALKGPGTRPRGFRKPLV